MIFDIFNGERYADMPVLCEKYHIFPNADDWKGHILLLESSEEKTSIPFGVNASVDSNEQVIRMQNPSASPTSKESI